MAFTAADYQGMSQERRRRRNPQAQVAQAASQARNQSSRQTPAGSDSMRLDRARPGVPAMPVRGLQGMSTSGAAQEGTGEDASEGAGVGSTGLDSSSGQEVQQTTATPARDASSIPGAAALGQLASGPGFMIPAGGFGAMLPQGSTPMESGTPSLPEQPQEEEQPLGDYVSPTGTDFGMAAGEDEFREGGGIGRIRGRAPGYGETLPGDAPEQSAQDELQEEFDQLMADLEAERESTAAAVNRDLAASQRRQAEINALAGRSIGGGFGGAVATTAVMGAAALEEADRAIRERMTNAQAAWLDGKRQALEREKDREQQKDMLRAQQSHELSVAAIEMGSVDGGMGATGTGGSVGAGAGASGGAGESAQGASGPTPQSVRDAWDEGWRRNEEGDLVNRDGDTWDDVYPGQQNPYSNSVTYGHEVNADVSYGGDNTRTLELNDNIEQFFNDPETYDHPGYQLAKEEYGWVMDYEGGIDQAWFDGELNLKEMYWLKNLAAHRDRVIEDYEDGDTDSSSYTSEFMSPSLDDLQSGFSDENFILHSQEYAPFFSEDVEYEMGDGTTIAGDDLVQVAQLLEDVSPVWAELIEGPPHGGHNVGPLMTNPSLLREVVSYMLSKKSDSGSGILYNTDFASDLTQHLEQAGYFTPGR